MDEVYVYEVCYRKDGKRFYLMLYSNSIADAIRIAKDALDVRFRDYLIVSVKQCNEF